MKELTLLKNINIINSDNNDHNNGGFFLFYFIERDSAMGSLSSLLTKKQDKNMNEEHEKQQDTEKHLLDKLPIGDVISCPLCGGETTFLEPDKCMTIDCPNCIF